MSPVDSFSYISHRHGNGNDNGGQFNDTTTTNTNSKNNQNDSGSGSGSGISRNPQPCMGGPASTTATVATAATTPSPADPKAVVDRLLARQATSMSFQDRQVVHEEIHGVRCVAPTETPEVLAQALEALDRELCTIRTKPAYDRAMDFSSTYVATEAFRLRFLRSTLLDAKDAARRMVSYLGLLWDHYGIEALRRPIRLDDLGREEMDVIRAGHLQLLPFRDRSGRRVMVFVADGGVERFSMHARHKVWLYMNWVASDDEESQRRGMVVVLWPGGTRPPLPSPNEHLEGRRIGAAAPIRMCAFHVCLPDTYVFNVIRSALILILGEKERARVKFHSGEASELHYQLLSFGIPVDLLPVTETGNLKVKNQQQWMKVRRAREQHYQQQQQQQQVGAAAAADLERLQQRPRAAAAAASGSPDNNASDDDGERIECPGLNDVVFRFGKSCMSHPGNVMFRGLIEAKFDEHDGSSSITTKWNATWWVVKEVLTARKGRFLVWDGSGEYWTQIRSRDDIRSRVAICFKEHKKRLKALRNLQAVESSTGQFRGGQDRKKRRLLLADASIMASAAGAAEDNNNDYPTDDINNNNDNDGCGGGGGCGGESVSFWSLG